MEGDIHSDADAGIVPRSVKSILESLEASGSEFTIRVSFLELYNEELQDLLVTPSQAASSEKKLKLCEDVKKGVVCQNLEEITVLSVRDIFEILQRGIKQRATAATLCNKNSSRSHSIFTLKIMIKECSVDGEEVVRHGQLNLVDLAGSECVGRSGAKNDRAKEAGSINQSLLTLGRVITALVDHHGHIPYRDSKLTRLLQESLGGKAKTCIIATLSPAAAAVEESLSTLDYAFRARNIKNAPQLNQRMTKKVVLKEYCAEIETLRAQLQLTREKNGIYVDHNEFYAMESRISSQEAQLLDCESALSAAQKEVKAVRSERDELHGTLDSVQRALEGTTAQLHTAETTLVVAKHELLEVKLELTSTEAVVSAQVDTESTLLEQGGQFASEVMARRADRENLLAKVERLVNGEELRQQEVNRFVSALEGRQGRLVQEVGSLVEHNAAQAAGLCDGVRGMLTQSRSTCSSLQQSIDVALATLMKDSMRACDSMTASCGQLDSHLSETDASLRAVLQGMQGTLSAWLGQVGESMQQATSAMEAQATVMDSMQASIAAQADQLSALNAAFLVEQRERAEAVTLAVNEVHQGIVEDLKAHEERVQRDCLDVQAGVERKAAAMEKTMQALLQELVASSSASLSQVAKQTAGFSASTTATLNKAAVAVAAQHADMHDRRENSISSANVAMAAASQSLQTSLNAARGHQVVSLCLVGGVSGAVEERRSVLDATVAQVSADISSAVETGCQSVRATAGSASTMLKDVEMATELMRGDTAIALEAFSAFCNTSGEEVCGGVSGHFAHLEQHLVAQQQDLDAVASETANFSSAFGGMAVVPTGQTPKKASFEALAQLARTKAHKEIKLLARSAAAAAAVVSSLDAGDVEVDVPEVASVVSGQVEGAESMVNGGSGKENTAVVEPAAKVLQSRMPAKTSRGSKTVEISGTRGRTTSATAPLGTVSLDAVNQK